MGVGTDYLSNMRIKGSFLPSVAACCYAGGVVRLALLLLLAMCLFFTLCLTHPIFDFFSFLDI